MCSTPKSPGVIQPIWDLQYFALSHRASSNVFLAKKQIFSKNANFVLDFKEAKLSPSWMVLAAEIWEHNETFCYYFLLFLDVLTKYFIVSSNLSRQHHSAGLNLASLKYKTKRAFFKNIWFFCQKTFLEALWDNAKYEKSQIGWFLR